MSAIAPRRHPLATFVPLVLERQLRDGWSPRPWTQHRHGAVLAADVSGSTALTSSLATRPDGIDELSTVLDAAFGMLIDAVTARGGDILGFIGDGATAFWPDDGAETAVASAMAAALETRDALASSAHPVRMRMGVAAGPVDLWNLGGERGEWMFVPSGTAVSEAMDLQAASVVGDVALAGGLAPPRAAGSAREEPQGAPPRTAVPRAGEEPGRGGATAASGSDALVVDLVRPYLPATVVARLVAGHRDYVSELRTVTSMFVSVPEMTTQANVGSLQDLVVTFQRVVHRFSSVINRISVDDKGAAALVVFGLPPHGHEDDADRALAAARQLDQEITARGLAHGIGLATGTSFCGVVGNDRRRHYTVLGDVVNVSARLAESALEQRGLHVLSDPATTANVARRWHFAPSISLQLRGKAEPLEAFPPLRRAAPAAVVDTPLVGRVEELARIERLLDGSTTTPGRLAVIAGEAGIGKSRLLAEVDRLAGAAGRLVLGGFGDALDASVPYHAWRPVLRTLLDVDALEPEVAARRLLDQLGERAPLLAPVMAVDLPDSALTAGLSGEPRVLATRRLLADLLEDAIAAHGPLTLTFEDVHWMDSASWSVVESATTMAGVVVVCTSRPLREPVPREVTRLLASPATEMIELGTMTPDEVVELARLRLGTETVAPDLGGLLQRRCAGNPFFVVEVVTSFQQSGVVATEAGAATLAERREVDVPATVHLAITSRVDQLGAEEQLTLKVASVVGDPFGVSTIAAIHPTKRHEHALVEDLDVLVTTDFAVPGDGHDAYAFKHALIRDSAYQLMLVDQRRTLHRRLAEHYESSPQEQPTAAAVLAHHWHRGADDDKAVRYLGRAAVDALAHGMPREAVDHGITAARILGLELPTDPAEITALLPAELAEVERLMAGRRPRELVGLPPLRDERVTTAIALVLQAMPSAHQSLQAELFALMAIRNLQMTLRFGAGPLASGVYAMYSILLRGLGLSSRDAFEFSQLARSVDAANGHVLPAAVAFIHVWFNNHWHEPMSTGVPIALDGGEAGLSGGDLLYGSFNLAAATTLLATSGRRLDQVIEMGEAHYERVHPHSATAAFHNRLETQMAKALSGRTLSLTSLSDEWCDETQLAAMTETDNFNQAAYYHIAKARLAYLAGDAGTACAVAQRAYELLPSFVGQVGQVELTVVSALARLATLPSEGPARIQGLHEARARLAQLEAWSEHCAANFQHKALLVAAELSWAEGDPASADRLFSAAVATAVRDGFVQFAALARERWGHSLLSRDPARAGEQLAGAADHYRAWGATRKARTCEEVLGEARSARGGLGPRSTTLHDTSGPRPTRATNGVARSS